MVEGASSFRCTRAPARTLAISWAQTRHADDYPPAQPAVPRGCRWGGDQEERDAACASPFLCHPSARAWDRYKTHPSAFRTRQIGYDGALHARRHGHDRKHQEPARPAVAASQEAQEEPWQEAQYRREQPAAGVTAAAMSRTKLEVADIFRGQGPAWRQANAGHVSLEQLKVMSAIENCRTAELGGHVARCENEKCGHTQIAYNSCRNRHCPKCQGAAAREWLAEREAELLPVPYFHVVFSLPAQIADIAYQNRAAIYGILFKASAETMLTIAADPKHLGARIGILSVLHTWGSMLTHHPHVHMIVPGGGISLDGTRWVACRPNFLLAVEVLSCLFRRLVLE